MRNSVCRLLLCVTPILFASFAAPLPAGAAQIYWSDANSGGIRRADLDGSNVTTLVAGPVSAGLAVDAAGGHLYWTDYLTEKIQRADLDGSNVTDLVSSPFPIGLMLDSDAGHLYWADVNLNSIRRANLDGSGVYTLVTGVDYGVELARDTAGGHIYWTNEDGTAPFVSDGVWRASLDGSDATLLAGGGPAYGLALDLVNAQLYWTEDFGGAQSDKIWRAGLDGSLPEVVMDTGDNHVCGLDLFGGRFYWTVCNFNGAIRSANVDGSDITTLVSGLDFPWAVTVVPEPATGLLLAGGLLALGLRRRSTSATRTRAHSPRRTPPALC